MNVNFLHAHILLTYRLILPFFLLILNIIQNLLNWVLVPIWSAIFSIVFRHRLVIFIQRALFQLMRFLNYFFLLELWPHNFIQPEVLSPTPTAIRERPLSIKLRASPMGSLVYHLGQVIFEAWASVPVLMLLLATWNLVLLTRGIVLTGLGANGTADWTLP